MLEKTKTLRGFELGIFRDYYDDVCTIQKSSLATKDTIWLGLSEARALCLASKAKALGIETDETTGWIDYPLPKDVFINTRMHLSKEEVEMLIPLLQKFVETGDI